MNQDQQSQIKLLIAKGKEQGFLTYAEVNDHLPDDIVDPQQIEDIINMINDMGITVHEEAPDSDTLLLATVSATDEDAAEEAAAALVTVDSEFGRTTDPVRMYMREMGTVELLTREGEIEIAKRIEDGLRQVLSALGSYPDSVGYLVSEYQKVDTGDVRLSDIISGFVDPDASDEIASPVTVAQGTASDSDGDDEDDDSDSAVVDTGPDPEEARERFVNMAKL
jgi:RNA polymerase primary sigma factor